MENPCNICGARKVCWGSYAEDYCEERLRFLQYWNMVKEKQKYMDNFPSECAAVVIPQQHNVVVTQPKQVFLIIRHDNSSESRKIAKAFSTREAATKLCKTLKECVGPTVTFEIVSVDVED